MTSLVVDTHAIVWFLMRPERLSAIAAQAMSDCLANGYPLYVPSICLIDLTYLVEKGRLPSEARSFLCDHLLDPDSGLVLARLGYGVADACARVPRDEVPDMPDRIIAATALHLQIPLVTCDRRLQRATVSTVW